MLPAVRCIFVITNNRKSLGRPLGQNEKGGGLQPNKRNLAITKEDEGPRGQDWRIFTETDWTKVGFNQMVQSLRCVLQFWFWCF